MPGAAGLALGVAALGLAGTLDDVEWGGDGVAATLLVVLALAHVAVGFAWGRWRAIAYVAAGFIVLAVGLDVLYFGLGLNLAGYCGEPECDPGPIPMVFALLVLPVPLVLTAIGVGLRHLRR